MKRWNIFLVLITCIIVFNTHNVFGQCTIIASASSKDIICGECVNLSVLSKDTAFFENFNDANPNGFKTFPQTDFSNPCLPGIDGAYALITDSFTRVVETIPIDISSGGESLKFDMFFPEQGGTQPCEGPDEPNEGISISFSVDNGVTWNTLEYFDPKGGNDPVLTNWNSYSIILPQASWSANTAFRFEQNDFTNADYDTWAIDNLLITGSNAQATYTWEHDGYSYSGGIHPIPVCLKKDSSFIVTMDDGTNTCKDTVLVTVNLPFIDPLLGPKEINSCGNCTEFQGNNKVFTKPPQIIIETDTATHNLQIQGGSIFPLPVKTGLIVQNLSNETVGLNTIKSICIDSMNISSSSVFFSTDISKLEFSLACPSGETALLFSTESLVSDTVKSLVLQNTCFNITSSMEIDSINGQQPYSANWKPLKSLNSLVGCKANGEWTIQILNKSQSLGVVNVSVNGWDIQFNDPGMFYEGTYSWSPQPIINVGEDSLKPIVCISNPSDTFVLSVSDTSGCITVSDTLRVNQTAQVDYGASLTVTPDTSSTCSGAINLTANGVDGPYNYNWSNGSTTSLIENLCAGNYNVTITENGGCDSIISVTIHDNFVWSGDANADGTANILDIFPIGFGYNSTGPIRANATINWQAEQADDWIDNSVFFGSNYKHADCNGDGIINAADTTAIIQNYGLIHNKTSSGSAVGVPLTFSSIDTISVSTLLQVAIELGKSTAPANDVYGITFSINFNSELIDSSSIIFSIANSWLGTEGTNLMKIQKNLYQNGMFDIGIIRTNHQGISGFGQIGTLEIVMQDDIAGKTTIYKDLNLSFSNVKLLDNDGNEIPVNPESKTVVVTQQTTSIGNIISENSIGIYPNPTKNVLHIVSTQYALIGYEIRNIQGQLVMSETGNIYRQKQLDVTDLLPGVYFLQLETDAGNSIIKRVMISE